MIKRLGESGAFVYGATRSAIYNFTTGRVYSIDQEGTKILLNYFSDNQMAYNSKFLSYVRQTAELSLEPFTDYVLPPLQPDLKFMWLELTQKCNFRCLHCYQGNSHAEALIPLSTSEWEDVISQCVSLGCRNIQLIGGEPTLCNDLQHIIEFAHNSGIQKISLFSNLFGVTDALVSTIVDNNVEVNFSIYGASASLHDGITRCPGSFDRLIFRINQLRQQQVPLNAKVVIMGENEGEYEKIIYLLKSLGVNSIHYDEIRKVYGGTQSNHIVTNSKLQHRHPNFRTSRAQFEKALCANTCWFGKMAISTDGTVYPCEFERQISLGSIREHSLKEILFGNEVKKYWYLTFDQIIPCKNCEYRFACRDCRPMAYAEHGCITDQNPRCLYNPITGEWN